MTSFDIDLNTNSMCTLKVTVRLMHNETYYNHTMPMIFELSGAISKWKSSLQQQSVCAFHLFSVGFPKYLSYMNQPNNTYHVS
jgi:hypothetical protein